MARKRSYQKGNVEMHNGQWTLRYREWNYRTRQWEQKRVRLEGDYKTEKAARSAADPIMARVNEHNNAAKAPEKEPEDRITFRQFVETRWRTYSKTRRHQASTQDAYECQLKNHLFPTFGDRYIAEITPGDITDFFSSLSELSLSTQRVLYALLRVVFDLAVEYEEIAISPVRTKLHCPAVERVEKPTLTPDQIRAVLRELEGQQRLLTLLVAITGKRIGEIMALRWQDFDPVRLQIEIRHTLYRGNLKRPKTESSKGGVKLPPVIAELLCAHRDQSAFQAPTDFIFCREDGRPLAQTALRSRLAKAMDSAGIERVKGQHGFHAFRHSAASLLYARSRDLKLVQSTLGHSNTRTTSDTYVHLSDEARGEGVMILIDEIIPNCDLIVTRKGRRAG